MPPRTMGYIEKNLDSEISTSKISLSGEKFRAASALQGESLEEVQRYEVTPRRLTSFRAD